MTAQTNAQKIATRQAAVRQWYHINVINNPLLSHLLLDADYGNARVGLLRWCQSHIRVASHLNGKLLLDDAKWEEVQEQLSYAPTLLATMVRGSDWPSVLGQLKSRYHVVDETVPTRWRLVRSTQVGNKLAVSHADIYKLIGGYGGIKGGGLIAPKPEEE